MTAVAGLEVGLPASIEEVDADWLTAVLHTSGAIGGVNRVESVELRPFAEGLGFLSILHRATLTYAEPAPGAPETVIVKMITDLDVQRGIGEALMLYERELRFYREVAPTVGYRCPQAHAAMMSETSKEFVLVLEDLSDLRNLDQTAGATAEDSLLAAATMARMHGRFASQDLTDLGTSFLPFDNPIYRAALPGVFDSGWATCKDVSADLLTPEVIDFGDRFAELVPFFMENFTSSTLIHGDWRADNLLVDDATGEMVVIDFQLVSTGPASYDLGYFMSQSMEPEVRREINDAMISTYFASLDATGHVYDREELMRAFRLASAWCLIYPVSQYAEWEALNETYQTTGRQMLRRAVTSIIDQNALELIG